MKNIRPETDYKNVVRITNFLNRCHVICLRVKILIEKVHNPLLSTNEINVVNEELDGFIVELEELTILLEQHGYMKA